MSTHNRHARDPRTQLQRDDDAFWYEPPEPEDECTLGYAEDVEEEQVREPVTVAQLFDMGGHPL